VWAWYAPGWWANDQVCFVWAWYAPCFVFPDWPLHCGRHCGKSAAVSHSRYSCAAWDIPTNNSHRLQNGSLLHLCFSLHCCFAGLTEVVHDVDTQLASCWCLWRLEKRHKLRPDVAATHWNSLMVLETIFLFLKMFLVSGTQLVHLTECQKLLRMWLGYV